MVDRQYMIKKRIIDALIEGFDWETNPDWKKEWKVINEKVEDFWKNVLKRKFNP